jgi:hypothetical protein
MALPQPSPVWPQKTLCCEQLIGLQVGAPHTYAVPPPPQVWPAGHVPQARTPPQPFGGPPQFALSAPQVVGLQSVPPQTLGVPAPPQVCG